MKKNSTDKLQIQGSMSEAGADRAGLIHAIAILVRYTVYSVSALILAIGYTANQYL